jgi:hypothetical protein
LEEKVSEAARSIPTSASAETANRTVKKPPFSTNSHRPKGIADIKRRFDLQAGAPHLPALLPTNRVEGRYPYA